MSSVLLDTHLYLWGRNDRSRLWAAELETIEKARFVFVSIAALWEVALLMSLGRIPQDQRLFDLPPGLKLLPATAGHTAAVARLPEIPIGIRSIAC